VLFFSLLLSNRRPLQLALSLDLGVARYFKNNLSALLYVDLLSNRSPIAKPNHRFDYLLLLRRINLFQRRNGEI